jgi:hypothetical protein
VERRPLGLWRAVSDLSRMFDASNADTCSTETRKASP